MRPVRFIPSCSFAVAAPRTRLPSQNGRYTEEAAAATRDNQTDGQIQIFVERDAASFVKTQGGDPARLLVS